jgi:7-keto-8-aminopelargonate synthetase-like enzyme
VWPACGGGHGGGGAAVVCVRWACAWRVARARAGCAGVQEGPATVLAHTAAARVQRQPLALTPARVPPEQRSETNERAHRCRKWPPA